MSGTQKTAPFVLPTGEGSETPPAIDIEAEVKAALERELRESEKRVASVKELPVAAPGDPEPESIPRPAPVPNAEPSVEISEAPPVDVDALRTQTAQKFVSLADDVTEAFAEFHIGGGNYVVELTAPAGPSTGGGTQALQHVRLRPRRPGYPVLVGGSVDSANKTAELWELGYVQLVHALRFDDALDVSAAEWEQFLRRAEVVLAGLSIATRRVHAPPDLLQRRGRRKISRPMLAVFVVVTVLAAGMLARIATVMLHR